MEAFLVCLTSIAIAEMGDRTQLLSLVLAARYRRPVADSRGHPARDTGEPHDRRRAG